MTQYRFRPADVSDPADLKAITDIYNAAVVEGGSTADLESRTPGQRRAWVESHRSPYGVFVVEKTGTDAADADGGTGAAGEAGKAVETGETVEGSGNPIVAFGALSVFYDRAGYDGVTDLAYYIAPEHRGRGAGTFLLAHLLDEAGNRGMRKAIGVIFADNAGSIALMRRFGFSRFGMLPAAATDATGAMHDMSYWYLDL